MNEKTAANLWGGRFTGETDSGFAEFNRSFGFDHRLFPADVQASIAHCDALVGADVLTADEAQQIHSALQEILERAQRDPDYFKETAEDVHSFVEARLTSIVGDLGRKLHTGRSRNDQVATDLRLWLRAEIDRIASTIIDTQEALLEIAEANPDVVIPGYTHLQRAQPFRAPAPSNRGSSSAASSWNQSPPHRLTQKSRTPSSSKELCLPRDATGAS